MDIETLRGRLATITDPQEKEGLETFIQLAEQMDPNSVIMGKIMMSPMKFAQTEAISRARDFTAIRDAFGGEFDVTIEEPGRR